MDFEELLKQAWLPIFDRFSHESNPSLDELVSRYSQYFAQPREMHLRPFTVSGLQAVLTKMKPDSAVGPDAWSVSDLKNLPVPLLQLLIPLFQKIEETGLWPQPLLHGYCSLIPKTEGNMSPLGQRPLGVMSCIYRLFAAYRLKDVISWQEEVIDEQQYGFRPGKGADDVFYQISLQIETSLLTGEPLIGVHLDYRKAYDLIPRNIVFFLAEELGFSKPLLTAMQTLYRDLRRYFKVPGGVYSPFYSTSGMLQGCPLSVVFMNVMVSVWAKLLHAESKVKPKAFADDSMFTGTSVDDIHTALLLTGEFATLTKQQLEKSKTRVWTTDKNLRTSLAKLTFDGQSLTLLSNVKSLGAMLSTVKTPVPSHFSTRFQNGLSLCQIIGALPLNAKNRGLICASKVMPYVFYATELCCPTEADLGRLRSAVARAVWRKRASRSTDVLLGYLHPIHRMDPKATWCFRVLSQLRRLCLRKPDLLDLLKHVWTLSKSKTTTGPVTAIFKAIRMLGWTWNEFDKFSRPRLPDLPWLSFSKSFFQHEIREALRRRNNQSANKRQDLRGITSNGGVDKDLLQGMLKQFKGYALGTFQAILTGGLRSAVNFCRMGLIFNPCCPFCGYATETVQHIFLHCPAWSVIRLHYSDVDLTWLQNQPECTQNCCIPLLPQAASTSPSVLWVKVMFETVSPLVPDDHSLEHWDGKYVVVWTDGSCREQAVSHLRRAGYGVVYDFHLQHSRTISKPLLGPQQTAQRAEVRAILAAILNEDRPVHIKSDSEYAVKFANNLLHGLPLPYDGSHLDLWRLFVQHTRLRVSDIKISWIKSHTSDLDVDAGLLSADDSAGNRAADTAAVNGAMSHAVPAAIIKTTHDYCQTMKRVSQMYTKIALERNRRAKKEKLPTYAKPTGERTSKKVPNHDYLFHTNSNQRMLPKFKRQPPFARKLRFRFGELAWNAIGWFLGQLQWPKDDETHGVTWCELALSFELATGLNLPRGAKQCEALFGSREAGRQAECANGKQTSHTGFLEHDVTKVVTKKAVRWKCRVCTRECARNDKSKFLKHSCAGYPETPLQAMRRHRLEKQHKNELQMLTLPLRLWEKKLK